MSIVAFTGVPGSGKSYALIEQVILPAVLAGRRVLTNVEGVNPQLVEAYCSDRATDPDKVGSVVLFDGNDALNPGFFPTESISDDHTVLKSGDYLVFDEWRLYWPRRGKMPNAELEPFLRWHRHLVADSGQSTDVAIGTQLATDVCQDFRGLIERTYKFRKLKALGRPKNYAWDVFEGHLQPKGGHYAQGLGSYKPEVFALYKSYAAAGGSENNNDKRASVFSRGFIALAVLVAVLFGLGLYGSVRFFMRSASPDAPVAPDAAASHQAGRSQGQQAAAPPTPPKSPYRIVGAVAGTLGVRVILAGPDGATRVVLPDGFIFDNDRPVSGTLDGQQVVAEDRVEGIGAPSPLQGVVP